jgi:hypothetical protein
VDTTLKPAKLRATDLDPWSVVSSLLFDVAQSSEDIISIVGRAGLNVDLNLSRDESFSHSTRKRAYRPRVQKAYLDLPPGDREIVLSLVISDLARRFPEQTAIIKESLVRIGWTLKSADAEPASNEPIKPMKRIKDLQRLLLIQVRDGEAPTGLETFSEAEQVYNSALLINDGYVEGGAIRGRTGEYASAVMTHLTSKGHDYLDRVENNQGGLSEGGGTTPNSSKLIFISHSSADADLAELVVDMLSSALHLRRAEFLCTSVDGSKLRGGDDTGDALRKEIRDVPVFLSLLTRRAMVSTYVLFELGARWGIQKDHIPLLAKGAGPDVLKEPLKDKNALQLSKEPEVLQLVEDVARALGKRPEPTSSYIEKVRKIAQTSQPGTGPSETTLANSFLTGLDAKFQIEFQAKARLKDVIRIVRDAGNLAATLKMVNERQAMLDPKEEQITVIENDRFAFHTDPNLLNRSVAEVNDAFKDGNGNSLYPGMKNLRSGLTTTRIRGYQHRLTAIAFEEITHPPCMIVVEVHKDD